MTIEKTLTNRSSIRAFTKEQVPADELTSIFNLAQKSVSNCNVQPWQVTVASGDKRDQLEKSLIKSIMGGAQPNPDFDWTPKYQDKHRERQFGAANELYSAMGIARDNKQARQASMLRNWNFFDAPHVAFFCMEKYLGVMGAVDMGIYVQTLNLIMAERGIDSCMQGALGQFPDVVRDILELPDELGILFGMSFGYQDKNAEVNQAKTDRVELNDSVLFVE